MDGIPVAVTLVVVFSIPPHANPVNRKFAKNGEDDVSNAWSNTLFILTLDKLPLVIEILLVDELIVLLVSISEEFLVTNVSVIKGNVFNVAVVPFNPRIFVIESSVGVPVKLILLKEDLMLF